jgi:hypothetical protein
LAKAGDGRCVSFAFFAEHAHPWTEITQRGVQVCLA